MIGIFHTVQGIFDAPGSHVQRIQRVGIHPSGPFQIFIMTYFICFILAPGQIKMLFSFFFGSYGILPFPSGGKIASGHPYRRNTQFFCHFQYILPEAVIIGKGMLRVPYPAIYPAPDGFQKRAEQTPVNFSNPVIRMHSYLRFLHNYPFRSAPAAGYRPGPSAL